MSGTYDVRNVVGGYNMIVETYNLSNSAPVVSGSRKYHAVGTGPPGQPAPLVPYVCPNGPLGGVSANIGMWLKTDLQGPLMQHSISADGKRLVGSSTSITPAQGGTNTQTSKWTMTALPPE